MQWNQLNDSVSVVQNKDLHQELLFLVHKQVLLCSQVCNIERGVWEGMDCVQADSRVTPVFC